MWTLQQEGRLTESQKSEKKIISWKPCHTFWKTATVLRKRKRHRVKEWEKYTNRNKGNKLKFQACNVACLEENQMWLDSILSAGCNLPLRWDWGYKSFMTPRLFLIFVETDSRFTTILFTDLQTALWLFHVHHQSAL